MAIATTGVREDMAVALVKTFARHNDQTILWVIRSAGGKLFRKNQVNGQWSKLLTSLRRLP